MEQFYFGGRIAAYRKEQGLTQEGLAQKLGVTNQAVSKWESDQCCPDIMLLPALADAFHISIDELFGRTSEMQPSEMDPVRETVICDLPWPDDDDLRAVCYVGHRLMNFTEVPEKRKSLGGFFNVRLGSKNPAELHFSGAVRDIHAAFDVVMENSTVTGSVYAEDSVQCADVGGDVKAGDGVSCGNVGGSVAAGDGINCGVIYGNVDAGDSVRCGDVAGNVKAGDSVYCANVGGDATAGDNIVCSAIGGKARGENIVTGKDDK